MMDDSVELQAPRHAFPTKRPKSEESSKTKRSKTVASSSQPKSVASSVSAAERPSSHGVSCSGLLCSWKPVSRDLLSAAVPSCCVYGFWSVPSWCFHCCVLFRPVMFLETSVERPPVCCSPVLLCLWLLIRAVMVFSVLCPVYLA